MSELSVPVWTWRQAIRTSKAPPATKLLCYTIALYVNDLGEGAWPSVKTLMADTGMSNKSVTTHLQHAVEAGLLFITREVGKDGRLKRYTYFPRFPDNCDLPRKPTPGKGVQVKELHQDSPGEKSTPGPDEKNAISQVKKLHLNNRTKDNTPEKDTRARVSFDGLKIELGPDLRKFWLDRFGGDDERLDLALIQAVPYIQPNSSRPLEAMVSSQLASVAGRIREGDRRAAKRPQAQPILSARERKIEGAKAFLKEIGLSEEAFQQ